MRPPAELGPDPAVGAWRQQIGIRHMGLDAPVVPFVRQAVVLSSAMPLAQQHDLWKWMKDNVDFRVRAANLF